jgi:hypothetical protein
MNHPFKEKSSLFCKQEVNNLSGQPARLLICLCVTSASSYLSAEKTVNAKRRGHEAAKKNAEKYSCTKVTKI